MWEFKSINSIVDSVFSSSAIVQRDAQGRFIRTTDTARVKRSGVWSTTVGERAYTYSGTNRNASVIRYTSPGETRIDSIFYDAQGKVIRLYSFENSVFLSNSPIYNNFTYTYNANNKITAVERVYSSLTDYSKSIINYTYDSNGLFTLWVARFYDRAGTLASRIDTFSWNYTMAGNNVVDIRIAYNGGAVTTPRIAIEYNANNQWTKVSSYGFGNVLEGVDSVTFRSANRLEYSVRWGSITPFRSRSITFDDNGFVTLDSIFTNTGGLGYFATYVTPSNCIARILNTQNAIVEAPKVQAFPNPATSQLTLRWDVSISQSAVIQILDLTGKIIATKQLSANETETQIDVSAMVSGIYLYKVQFDNRGIAVGKFMISQ
jgi:hypothetical protein